MSKRLNICRLAVAILLFNTIAPALASVPADDFAANPLRYTLLCTSQGLTVVDLLSVMDEDVKPNTSPPSNHCVYCLLNDTPLNVHVELTARALFDAQFIPPLTHRTDWLLDNYQLRDQLLRAPPIHL